MQQADSFQSLLGGSGRWRSTPATCRREDHPKAGR